MCALLVPVDLSLSVSYSNYDVSWDDMTRFRFRDTAVCRTVVNPARYVLSECTPIIPIHVHVLPTRTAHRHGVREYYCVTLCGLASFKLHTRELPNLCPHT